MRNNSIFLINNLEFIFFIFFLEKIFFLSYDYKHGIYRKLDLTCNKHERLSNFSQKKSKEVNMRLTPPKKIVFMISLILAIVSLVASFVDIPVATQYQYWVMVAAWAILAAGVFLKGF